MILSIPLNTRAGTMPLYDTSTVGLDGGTLNGATWTMDNAQDGEADYVIVFANNSGDVGTTVTDNGVSMTLLDSCVRSNYALQYTYHFILLNQAAGTHTFVVSTLIGVGNSSAYSASYKGAGSVESHACESHDSTGTDTIATDTTSPDAMLIGGFVNYAGVTPSAGTDTTKRSTNTYGGIYDSDTTVLTPGSNSLNATQSPEAWTALIVSLAPSGPPPSTGCKVCILSNPF